MVLTRELLLLLLSKELLLLLGMDVLSKKLLLLGRILSGPVPCSRGGSGAMRHVWLVGVSLSPAHMLLLLLLLLWKKGRGERVQRRRGLAH